MREAPSIGEDDALVRSPAVLWRGFPGHLVVATVDHKMRRATGPAFEIWVELDRPIAVSELADLLSHRHGVAREQILADVIPFLSDMVASGYVVITGSDLGDPSRPVQPAIRTAARLGLTVEAQYGKIEPDAASDVLAWARFDRMTGFLAAAVLEGSVEADDEITQRTWSQHGRTSLPRWCWSKRSPFAP